MNQKKVSKVIAVDAMGGDYGPEAVINGAKMAIAKDPNLRFVFYGDSKRIKRYISGLNLISATEVVHTDYFIKDDEKPSSALRGSKSSSMRMAINSVKSGEAGSVISSGNTGALMAIAKIVLKTLPDIERPAIAALLPTMREPLVMLDLGANASCPSDQLMQFAVMGDAFAKALLGKDTPRIGLLNIGSEEVKGNEIVKLADSLIKSSFLKSNYHGFVEANDITKGVVDVVVTDGFTGNIALKMAEGTAQMCTKFLKDSLKSSLLARLGYFFLSPALRNFKNQIDPRKYNGAMLLGLNGIVVKSHGSADAIAFASAINVAAKLAEFGINDKVSQEINISQYGNLQTNL